jgi:hypothetical protein
MNIRGKTVTLRAIEDGRIRIGDCMIAAPPATGAAVGPPRCSADLAIAPLIVG